MVWTLDFCAAKSNKCFLCRYVTHVSFSPDDRFLVTGSNDKTIKLWKVEHNKHTSHNGEWWDPGVFLLCKNSCLLTPRPHLSRDQPSSSYSYCYCYNICESFSFKGYCVSHTGLSVCSRPRNGVWTRCVAGWIQWLLHRTVETPPTLMTSEPVRTSPRSQWEQRLV